MTELTLPAFTDAHVHLRQGAMTSRVAPFTAECCDNAVAMPNTRPPLHSPESLRDAREDYQAAMGTLCRVHLTAKLLPTTTPEDIRASKGLVVGWKLYPAGGTTHAEDAIPEAWLHDPPKGFLDVVAAIADCGLALLCHGECPSSFCLDRETAFLPFWVALSERHPAMSLTLEHISSEDGVNVVRFLASRGRPVLGTITAHHLLRTLDDVVGGKLRPDEFCMPIPKSPKDRRTLVQAATDPGTCFALGSDSAPHEPEAKYCDEGCAGVFSAPVLAESVVEVFEVAGKLDDRQALTAFTSGNANRFYGFAPSGREIVLAQDGRWVAGKRNGVVPWRAGERLPWRLVEMKA